MNESTIGFKIKENLLFLTRKYNISEAELGRRANVPQATVNRLLNGTTDDPRASTLKTIADFFNITVDQLLSDKLVQESSFDTTRLPVYAMSQKDSILNRLLSKKGIEWGADLTNREGVFLEVEPSIGNNCLAFEVKGDSMWPQFIEGIFVVIETTSQIQHRDFVMYLIEKTKQIVLRQYIEDGNDRILKPLNFAYKQIQITPRDKLIGKVIQAKSDFRKF